MRLAEETILMLLNEESGYLEQVQGWNLSCVLAGAVLADLALEGRIDTEDPHAPPGRLLVFFGSLLADPHLFRGRRHCHRRRKDPRVPDDRGGHRP